MPEKKKKNIPSQTYDIEIKIKDLDYTNDLRSLKIISSLASPYPVFEFTLVVDPDDVVLEGLFGEDIIKLTLMSVGRDEALQEELDMKLMLLDTDQPLGGGKQLELNEQKNRTKLTFMAVCVDSFKTITSNVNEVFLNNNIKGVIQQLVSDYTNAELKMDSEGANQENIPQLVIPPTTLYRVIKEKGHRTYMDGYLDNQFGLFDGIPAVYCTYDNILKIMNLTKRMKKSQDITIYQLSEDGDHKKIYDKSIEGESYYTYTEIKNTYSGNSKFSSLSKNIRHIVKPSDKLYHIIEQDLNDVVANYGTIDKNKKVQFNKDLSNRTRYNISNSGHEESEIFANSDVASLIGNMSSIEIGVERMLYIEPLLNVGSVVKFDPEKINYIDYEGKYILYSTLVNFSREGPDWSPTCNIKLVRTNKTI